jgi:hypothetical protein
MNEDYCPICYSELEVRDVAPCMDCGHRPEEIEHTLAGRHTYTEIRIFDGLSLVLCDFCQVDFGSYYPTYFGAPAGIRIGYQKMQFVRDVEDQFIRKDKCCPECERRLPFLKFLKKARELFAQI